MLASKVFCEVVETRSCSIWSRLCCLVMVGERSKGAKDSAAARCAEFAEAAEGAAIGVDPPSSGSGSERYVIVMLEEGKEQGETPASGTIRAVQRNTAHDFKALCSDCL